MHRRAYRRVQHAALGGLCLVLVLPLLSVRLGEAPPARAEMDAGDNTATIETDLVVPQTVLTTGLENYAEITARPLFSRSRRPADATAATTAPARADAAQATTAPDFQLSAVIIIGKQRIALLRPLSGTPPDAEPKHVALGERYRGWRLTEISNHAISVKRNGQEHTLELDRTFSPPERAPSRSGGPQTAPPAAPAPPIPAGEAADQTQGAGE